MMKNRNYILLLIVFGVSLVAFSFAELDPGYAKAFGWGSICVSKAGYPQKSSYDASQYEFDGNKFYVNIGDTICFRSILPKGKTYGDLLKEFTNKHKEFSKMTEEVTCWDIYSNCDFAGNVLFDKWPANPKDMINANNPLCFLRFNAEGNLRSWNSSGVFWSNIKGDLGLWLENAKPGWQLYILHTVGFIRNCPELKYWDYSQGKEIIPIGFEWAKPIAYTIVEIH